MYHSLWIHCVVCVDAIYSLCTLYSKQSIGETQSVFSDANPCTFTLCIFTLYLLSLSLCLSVVVCHYVTVSMSMSFISNQLIQLRCSVYSEWLNVIRIFLDRFGWRQSTGTGDQIARAVCDWWWMQRKVFSFVLYDSGCRYGHSLLSWSVVFVIVFLWKYEET